MVVTAHAPPMRAEDFPAPSMIPYVIFIVLFAISAVASGDLMRACLFARVFADVFRNNCF